MAFLLTLLDLAGAVALLLWGVRMVQTGVQRAFGARLHQALGAALRRRWTAFLAGLGITALLQSSTAAGLMLTGFAASGLVELAPALAVMLGANVGTTLIVQVFSFDVAAASPALVLAGVLMFRRGGYPVRDLGRAVIGLGLMLMALSHLLDVVQPFATSRGLQTILRLVSAEPLLDVALAAGLTWAAHSSVAIVLLVMSLARQGTVPPEAALAFVLGANLGTAINPCLEGGTAGRDPAAARRLPLGNLATRVLGVALALLVLPFLGRLMAVIEPNPARAVADFHTLFNLALAALFLPVLPAYARLLRRWLPAKSQPDDPGKPLYLDPAARETPPVALGHAAREALRLADALEAMLRGLQHGITKGDRRQLIEARQRSDVLDRLDGAIKAYLTGLDPEAMDGEDHRRLAAILAFATGLRHAGDLVERDLLGHAAKALKRGLSLPREAQAAFVAVTGRLAGNARAAASLLVTEDVRAARLLAGEKEAFRDIEAAATAAHFERLRAGDGEAEAGALWLDILRDLKRVNAHLVAAAAYPVLEEQGELLPTRLRQDG